MLLINQVGAANGHPGRAGGSALLSARGSSRRCAPCARRQRRAAAHATHKHRPPACHAHAPPHLQTIAGMIRHLLDAYTKPVPAILEIPSKDAPYDPAQDSVLQRVRFMFGES